MNDLYEIIQKNQVNKLLLNITAGSILWKVKQHLSKEEFLTFLKSIKFSLSWCYFLIKLHGLFSHYKGLQQISTSMRFIHTNFSIIKEYINKYSEEWNDYK